MALCVLLFSEQQDCIAVQGRFLTSPSLAKGEEKTLSVVEYLAGQVRAGH